MIKVIINLTEQEYKKFKEYKGQIDLGRRAIRNGTPILDNTTCGEIIETMFPELSFEESDNTIDSVIQCKELDLYFERNWWFSKYKEKEKGE